MPNHSALLIGVDDYSLYDASAGNAPGTSDLQGGRNDVRAWLRLCKEIGIGTIRVLTSPAIELAEPGVECREATAQEIREGVAWLAEQLGGIWVEPGPPLGVLVFSGHGDQTSNEGLVLCPADAGVSGEELTGVVSLDEIQKMLASKGAERNLTVVLDCCHDGDAAVSGRHRVTALRPRLGAMAPVRPRVGERMFCAASLGEPSYQGAFGVDDDTVHGAFTWAFMTARSRWSTRPQGATSELSISYARMRDAARDLLRAIDVGQTPEFDGHPGTATLPIFHRGMVAGADETSPTADGEMQIKQCDPGIWDYRIYTFMQGLTKIADMLVARTADPHSRYSVGTEYWFMRNVPQSRSTTTVSMVDYPWTTPPPGSSGVSFTMVQNATWSSRPPVNTTDPLLWNGSTSAAIGIQWKLTLSGAVWGGSIIWSRSNPGSSNPNTLFAGPAQTQTFTLASSVPSQLTYNAVVLPAR